MQLLAESDPLPPGQIFRVYRGVAGEGEFRREQGLAWTLDRAIAERFAQCSREIGLSDPVILEGRVSRKNLLSYINWLHESEMICTDVEVVGQTKLHGSTQTR